MEGRIYGYKIETRRGVCESHVGGTIKKREGSR